MPTRLLNLLLLLCFVASACTQEPDAQQIVDQAIVAHGGEHYDNLQIEYDFRGKHFKIIRDGGLFSYERIYTDSTGQVREVLNNDDLYRLVNGERVTLTDKENSIMEEAINSVVYFSLLPFPLNDPAVIKHYLGESTLEGEPYHKVEVTFQQEGGGKDYQDRFVYWFHQDRHTMDYFAYYYYTNVTGSRFRQAVNIREVGGIRFSDHLNFGVDSLTYETVHTYDDLWNAGEIPLFSEINHENITVKLLNTP